jgi:hypothetical protein
MKLRFKNAILFIIDTFYFLKYIIYFNLFINLFKNKKNKKFFIYIFI